MRNLIAGMTKTIVATSHRVERVISALERVAEQRGLTKLADDENDTWSPEVNKVLKKGQWNVILYKSRATRWDFSVRNPHGGSSGSSSYTSAKAAFTAATYRMDFEGADKVWVINAVWDPDAPSTDGEPGAYRVTKSGFVPLPGK